MQAIPAKGTIKMNFEEIKRILKDKYTVVDVRYVHTTGCSCNKENCQADM
jgi:hypothetical protein